MAAAMFFGVAGLLLGALLGMSVAKKKPVVVDDGSRSRELQATTARRLAEARADKLQAQVERLRAACLLPTTDATTTTTTTTKHTADAAARLVRVMGGVSAAVVAGPDGLSLSGKETALERSLAALVPALSPLSSLAPSVGTTGEVVVVLRSGLGVRARMLSDGQMLVIAAAGGVPSPLLTRAAYAELNIAAPAKVAAAPLSTSFELGAAARVKEMAARAGFTSVALLSGDSIELAVSALGLSLESLRAVRRPLQLTTVQVASVMASPVARLELAGEQQLSLVAGELGWWLALHPTLVLDDMTVRRFEGAQRVSLQTKVA